MAMSRSEPASVSQSQAPNVDRLGQRIITLSNPYLDSRELTFEGELLRADGLAEKFNAGEWDGRSVKFDLRLGAEEGPFSMGFYEHEEFGAWSRIPDPWLILPVTVRGNMAVRLAVRGYGPSVGGPVSVEIGGVVQSFILSGSREVVTLVFENVSPTAEIHFSGLSVEYDEDADDPRTMGLGLTSVELRKLDGGPDTWDGTDVTLGLGTERALRLWGVGFYYLEDWGAWSRDSSVSLVLPFALDGKTTVVLDIIGHGPSVGHSISARIGDDSQSFELAPGESKVELHFDIAQPSAVMTLSGLIAEPTPGQADQRTLAIGLKEMSVRRDRRGFSLRGLRRGAARTSPNFGQQQQVGSVDVSFDGVVYSVVLTPASAERDDWKEMMAAFCWAFRDDPGVALVIQAPNTSIASFFSKFVFHLYRIGNVRCPIYVTLPQAGTVVEESLAATSTFYVHLDDTDEGRVIFHRYLRSGTPAVASLGVEEAARYGDALILATPMRRPSRVPGSRCRVSRTMTDEIDWNTVEVAFEQSHHLATKERDRYASMQKAARDWGVGA